MKKSAAITLVLLFVCVIGALFWQRSRKPVFIGYHGSQPAMRTSLSGTATPEVLSQVIDAAKSYARSSKIVYWPEPCYVAELEDSWWVSFRIKDRLFQVGSEQRVHTQKPADILVRVSKDNFSTSWISTM
jgi:hypothetical protein